MATPTYRQHETAFCAEVSKWSDKIFESNANLPFGSSEIESYGRAAIPVLIDTLRDPSKVVRVLAADTLAQIAGQNLGLERDKWLAWWKTEEGRKQ